jgi:2-amino-4-hydroxy-6-hydroxymethyldihydropteridine diphosphokinase
MLKIDSNDRSKIAYISLGSNLGNKRLNIAKALLLVGNLKKNTLTRVSDFYKTSSEGKNNQPSFINIVAEIRTFSPVINLLKGVLKIERKMGRVHLSERWEPRIIDIDILMYNNDIYYSSDLIIPHPRMHKRLFVLKPLCDISPDLVHPIFHKSIRVLLKELLYENNK